MAKKASLEVAERALMSSVGLAAEGRFITLARIGCEAHVLDTGNASDGRPPVLFVHGVMSAGASWASLAASLPEFRCLLLDRPGCGRSDLPASPPRSLPEQERFADDLLVDVLDGLGLVRAHVISTSLGGWHALRSVAAHPQRFDRLVGLAFQGGAQIAGAPLTMRLRTPPWLAGKLPVPRRVVRSMLRAAGMRRVIDSGSFSDEMIDWLTALLNATDTMRNELLTAPAPIGLRGPISETQHSLELLGKVTVPVHLFWGTDDPFGGEHSARLLADQLPDATVEMVEDAGHAPWFDEPQRAVDAIRAHLTAGT